MADGPEKKIEHAVNSTFAVAMSRWVTPTLLALVAWFGQQALADIKRAQAVQVETMAKLERDQASLSADVRVLSSRLDYAVIQQLQSQERRIERLEQSVRAQQRQ